MAKSLRRRVACFCPKTHRSCEGWANAVAFALPLVANEINPVDLLLLEGVKCSYPTLHEHIRLFPGIYTGEFGWDIGKAIDGGKQAQSEIRKQLELLTTQAADRAKHLLTQLFPQLHDLLGSGKYGSVNAERAQRDQRVSVLDYLNRYLTCSIPTGDISDKEIDDYLRRVSTMTEADAADAYWGLLRQGQEHALLLKLKTHEFAHVNWPLSIV
jgi:predicted KAP-like P-loop ATPase